jgi:hypothetical protein
LEDLFDFFLFLQTLYMFQAVPFAHHQEHTTVYTASGIVKAILLLVATVEVMVLHLVQSLSACTRVHFTFTLQ